MLAGVFLAGVTLRAWAIHELGAQYSHRVVRISESGLICSGPYRVLRHPAYAGMLLANIGFVGYFASPASIAALALLAAAILWRIRVEEDVLVRSPEISRIRQHPTPHPAGSVVMIKIVDAPAELADASLVGHKFARQQRLRDAGVRFHRSSASSSSRHGQPSPMWWPLSGSRRRCRAIDHMGRDGPQRCRTRASHAGNCKPQSWRNASASACTTSRSAHALSGATVNWVKTMPPTRSRG